MVGFASPRWNGSKFLLSCALLFVLVAMLGGCTSELQKNRELGVSLYQKEHYDQSLAALTTALKCDEFDAVSNTYAGLIHYRAGNYQQACYHFKTALQADPSSEQAKAGLTAALIRLDKPDLALDYLERASALAEKVKDPRWKKSFANRRYQDQTDEGLFTGRAGDRLRIGRTYEKLGDYDNALLYYKKALAVAPDNPSVLFAVGLLFEKTGDKTVAREYLIKAYMADPSTPGLTEALTRNGIAISDVLGVPKGQESAVPAPK